MSTLRPAAYAARYGFASACQHGASRLVSTLRLTPSLVGTLRPKGLRFQPVVSIRNGKLGNPPSLRTGTLCAEGRGRSWIWLKVTEGSVLTSEGVSLSVLTSRRSVAKPACDAALCAASDGGSAGGIAFELLLAGAYLVHLGIDVQGAAQHVIGGP
jgi:hypothetical protein